MTVPFKAKNCPVCQGHVLIGIISQDNYFLLKCPHCSTKLLYDFGKLAAVDGGQQLQTKENQ